MTIASAFASKARPPAPAIVVRHFACNAANSVELIVNWLARATRRHAVNRQIQTGTLVRQKSARLILSPEKGSSVAPAAGFLENIVRHHGHGSKYVNDS